MGSPSNYQSRKEMRILYFGAAILLCCFAAPRIEALPLLDVSKFCSTFCSSVHGNFTVHEGACYCVISDELTVEEKGVLQRGIDLAHVWGIEVHTPVVGLDKGDETQRLLIGLGSILRERDFAKARAALGSSDFGSPRPINDDASKAAPALLESQAWAPDSPAQRLQQELIRAIREQPSETEPKPNSRATPLRPPAARVVSDCVRSRLRELNGNQRPAPIGVRGLGLRYDTREIAAPVRSAPEFLSPQTRTGEQHPIPAPAPIVPTEPPQSTSPPEPTSLPLPTSPPVPPQPYYEFPIPPHFMQTPASRHRTSNVVIVAPNSTPEQVARLKELLQSYSPIGATLDVMPGSFNYQSFYPGLAKRETSNDPNVPLSSAMDASEGKLQFPRSVDFVLPSESSFSWYPSEESWSQGTGFANPSDEYRMTSREDETFLQSDSGRAFDQQPYESDSNPYERGALDSFVNFGREGMGSIQGILTHAGDTASSMMNSGFGLIQDTNRPDEPLQPQVASEHYPSESSRSYPYLGYNQGHNFGYPHGYHYPYGQGMHYGSHHLGYPPFHGHGLGFRSAMPPSSAHGDGPVDQAFGIANSAMQFGQQGASQGPQSALSTAAGILDSALQFGRYPRSELNTDVKVEGATPDAREFSLSQVDPVFRSD